jgi:hypothetical protein
VGGQRRWERVWEGVHMYVNEKVIPVETISGMGGRRG